MAITIVATVGSASANSFVTEVEADAYLAERLNATAYTGADAELQKAALVEATREISLLPWKGSRTDSTQALSLPRTGLPNPDAPWDAEVGVWSGEPEYASDVVPGRVKDATIELALEYLRAGTTDISKPSSTAGVKRKVIGPLETEWFSAASQPVGLSRYTRIMALLGPLLLSGSGQREVARS